MGLNWALKPKILAFSSSFNLLAGFKYILIFQGIAAQCRDCSSSVRVMLLFIAEIVLRVHGSTCRYALSCHGAHRVLRTFPACKSILVDGLSVSVHLCLTTHKDAQSDAFSVLGYQLPPEPVGNRKTLFSLLSFQGIDNAQNKERGLNF